MLDDDVFQSPVGPVLVAVDEAGAVARVEFLPAPEDGDAPVHRRGGVRGGERTADAVAQLQEYFAGRRREFQLPLAMKGTDFQCRVWRELLRIPYGETRTYGQVAAAVGRPRAARAVGRAAGANRIPVLIPCHRVVGADGSLTGFAGGLRIKGFLLALENRRGYG